MAGSPSIFLSYKDGCPDCAIREVALPEPLPGIGEDFDWLVRDYDGFRMFMLEELAARFPERTRWTPADLEVVLVEVLAAVLDQLSDMLDRITGESSLETARRPESLFRLLRLIGFDAVADAKKRQQINGDLHGEDAVKALLSFWNGDTHAMERVRRAGPRDIHKQKRMVTVDDYATRLEQHPLVMRAHAWREWRGSWQAIRVGIIVWNHVGLDEEKAAGVAAYPKELVDAITGFHLEHGLFVPPNLEPVGDATAPSARCVLRHYIDGYRMAGQEVLLEEAVPVAISMAFSVRINENYYQSEIRRAIEKALGVGPGGFFEPGRLRFGEDLHASDIVHLLMSMNGVEQVCLNRFKRLGSLLPDCVEAGHIPLDGLEIAVCDNDPVRPERGYFRLKLHGGRKG